MARSWSPDPRLSRPLRQRIERAAHDLNPYLLVLAIGLALLNLTGLVVRVPHITFSRGIPTDSCAPASGPPVIVSGADAALRAGS